MLSPSSLKAFSCPKDFIAFCLKTGQGEKIILGIDHGKAHIGFALASLTLRIPFPLSVLKRRSWQEDAATIENLLRQRQACGLVVGYPLLSSGKEGRQCLTVRQFCYRLLSYLQNQGLVLPLYLQDERLSTQEALLSLEGVKNKKRLDAIAASILLKDLLSLAH